MSSAKSNLPENERLAEVRLFNELDFDRNQELKDLVNLAAAICGVPIAMLTLMDEQVQRIRCVTGVEISENSRENSFCKYLINADEVMVVSDTLTDPRFVAHEEVTGPLSIRFYAGAPLIGRNGHHLGSLCIFDQQPHQFSDQQKQQLAILSRQAVRLMELERSLGMIEERNTTLQRLEEASRDSERKLRAFFNSSSSNHLLFDRQLQVVDFNQAAAQFVKDRQKKTIRIGDSILDFITPDFETRFRRHVTIALSGKRSKLNFRINYFDHPTWWHMQFTPVKDAAGTTRYIAFHSTNITQQRDHEAEIVAKNASLTNIAFIQSHEYRRPVASILSIMELIRADGYRCEEEYFRLLEGAVQELDDKIRTVAGVIDEVNSPNLKVFSYNP